MAKTFACGFKCAVITDMVAAGLAIFRVQTLEAAAAEWAAVLHNVPLSPQHGITLKAAEVFHVPVATFSFCAFISKNNLKFEESALLGNCPNLRGTSRISAVHIETG